MKHYRRRGRLWRCLGWLLFLCFVFWAAYSGYSFYKSGFALYEPFLRQPQTYALYFLLPSALCFAVGYAQRRRAHRAYQRRQPH